MIDFLNTFADNIVSHFGRFFWVIKAYGFYLVICGIFLLIFLAWIGLEGKVKTRADVGKEMDEDD